jgi:hypothetical protein
MDPDLFQQNANFQSFLEQPEMQGQGGIAEYQVAEFPSVEYEAPK